jgi:hypothetical protein
MRARSGQDYAKALAIWRNNFSHVWAPMPTGFDHRGFDIARGGPMRSKSGFHSG